MKESTIYSIIIIILWLIHFLFVLMLSTAKKSAESTKSIIPNNRRRQKKIELAASATCYEQAMDKVATLGIPRATNTLQVPNDESYLDKETGCASAVNTIFKYSTRIRRGVKAGCLRCIDLKTIGTSERKHNLKCPTKSSAVDMDSSETETVLSKYIDHTSITKQLDEQWPATQQISSDSDCAISLSDDVQQLVTNEASTGTTDLHPICIIEASTVTGDIQCNKMESRHTNDCSTTEQDVILMYEKANQTALAGEYGNLDYVPSTNLFDVYYLGSNRYFYLPFYDPESDNIVKHWCSKDQTVKVTLFCTLVSKVFFCKQRHITDWLSSVFLLNTKSTV
jgi:hypothetical protein